MTVAIAASGLLVFALGVLGIVQPMTLVRLVERAWKSRTGFYLAIVFRTALGVLLLAAASSTNFPWVIGVLGGLSLVAAGAVPLLGYDRLRAFVHRWAGLPTGILRAASFVASAFGVFLIYAVV